MPGLAKAVQCQRGGAAGATAVTLVPLILGTLLSLTSRADLFEERAEVAHDVERRPNAIYLYGVDVMSTGRLHDVIVSTYSRNAK